VTTPQTATTLHELVAHQAARRPRATALVWQGNTTNYATLNERITTVASVLAACGRIGDRVAVLAWNCPEVVELLYAGPASGRVLVPLNARLAPAELLYQLRQAEVSLLIGDRALLQPLTAHAEFPPALSIITLGQPYEDWLATTAPSSPPKIRNTDTAWILYTSGTTGQPKGVVLSFENVIRTARNAVEFEGLTEAEEVLAYLPMAWVGDNVFSVAQSYVAGFCVSCPESAETVMQDLRELGPSYFFAPPRIFENILTTVMIRMEDAGWIKRKMFQYFMAVAKRHGIRILDGKSVSIGGQLLYGLGGLLIYGPLLNTLGFSRLRVAYTAGEAIGPDIFDFYRALGVNLKQLYGSTEACVSITAQPDGEVLPDTVGRPSPEVEIKITEAGEILFRSPGVFQEYYKNPEETARTKTEDGWVHTGDAGFFSDNGHLTIIDRAKDVGKLTDGTLFAPKYIENKLKFFPEIKEAVAFGHDRDFCGAFVNIDLEAVGNWAERHNIAYASYQELAAHPEVQQIVRKHIEKVNRDLAKDPNLAGSQIQRFLILPKELDPDDGELTRTGKVRRRFVSEKYQTLIEALYSGAEHAQMETEVAFKDGRKGSVSADIAIVAAEIIPGGAPGVAPLKQAS